MQTHNAQAAARSARSQRAHGAVEGLRGAEVVLAVKAPPSMAPGFRRWRRTSTSSRRAARRGSGLRQGRGQQVDGGRQPGNPAGSSGTASRLLDSDIWAVGADDARHPRQAAGDRTGCSRSKVGIKTMSLGFIVDTDTPVIWRGPMVMKAIEQMLGDVDWGELDYMILDLPPGTGDAQLTVTQKVPLSGAVIVTTPQDVALIDARKGLAMFRKVNVPVVGIVENMSTFVCPACGHETAIFRSGGGERTAQELGVPFLGSIPLDADIGVGGDAGVPIVVAQQSGPPSDACRRRSGGRRVAKQAAERLTVDRVSGCRSLVADAHLGGPGGDAGRSWQLEALPAQGCSRLILMGDLFHVFVGFRNSKPRRFAPWCRRWGGCAAPASDPLHRAIAISSSPAAATRRRSRSSAGRLHRRRRAAWRSTATA
jgi:hypothetical protein